MAVVATPELHLRTLFILDERGRIVSTREPDPRPGPRFTLIRGASSCAWAVRTDVSEDQANELRGFATKEPPIQSLAGEPRYAHEYLAVLHAQVGWSGPAFAFPERINQPPGVVLIDNFELIDRNFPGWTASEIPERSPIFAVIEAGYPVSICFCARNTEAAAEAGVDTAPDFRGRGLAPRVTAAWALAIRASGRIPLYSTSWSNTASRAVARKLGLIQYANDWSVE